MKKTIFTIAAVAAMFALAADEETAKAPEGQTVAQEKREESREEKLERLGKRLEAIEKASAESRVTVTTNENGTVTYAGPVHFESNTNITKIAVTIRYGDAKGVGEPKKQGE